MPQIEPDYYIKGPKKVLHIYDSAFALPDDFNGSIQDAMKLFLEYHEKMLKQHKEGVQIDQSRLFTPMGVLAVAHENNDNLKCCVEARIYELNEFGRYVDVTPKY